MARSFDGVDDYLWVAHSSSVQPTTAFTFGMWVYLASTGSDDWSDIVSKGSTNKTLCLEKQGATNDYSSFLTIGTTASYAGNMALPTNTWIYVSLRWQSGGPLTFQAHRTDGTQVGSFTSGNATGTLASNTLPLEFMRAEWGSYVAGRAARIFFHNGYLTDAQMTTLRGGEAPVTPTGGYWLLNGTGTTEASSTSGGSTINIVGATAGADETGLPSLSKSYTPSAADTAAGTDTPSTTMDVNRLPADTAAGSDGTAVNRSITVVGPSATDAWVGADPWVVTDAWTGHGTGTTGDTLTATDSADAVVFTERTATAADAAIATDNVSILLGGAATVPDVLTVTDTTAHQQILSRSPTDTTALTDTATAAKATQIGADTADLTDSVQTSMVIRRTVTETVQAFDTHWLGGTGSRPVRSTAEVVATSSIGMRRTARLRAQTGIAVHTFAAGNLVKGPQRMPVSVTVTGDLRPVRVMEGRLDPVIDFLRPQVRIVRSMTTAIRMTDDELAMQVIEARRMTNLPEPEPVVEEDPDWLPESVVTSGPRRFSRSFEILRS